MNRPADLFSIPVSPCDVTGDGAAGTVDRQGGSVNILPSVCTNLVERGSSVRPEFSVMTPGPETAVRGVYLGRLTERWRTPI
jgi:hypothetical protein